MRQLVTSGSGESDASIMMRTRRTSDSQSSSSSREDSSVHVQARLQSAVRNQTNKDIAASIVGHIRRAALGEALKPFEQRVAEAMDRIYAQHSWTPKQLKWLERLGKQLVHEVIIDRDFVNQRFGEQGGVKALDKVLENQLDTVLNELGEAIWPPVSA